MAQRPGQAPAAALDALRAAVTGETPLDGPSPGPGIDFRADPAAGITGRWRSPRGRLLELETEVVGQGEWFGLHVALDLPDLSGIAWIGVVMRSAAGRGMVSRACLRSGLPGEDGFRDTFFPRDILSQPGETDHVDILDPAREPGLPPRAPWRDLVIFLPPTMPLRWALHDLRIVLA